MDILTQRKWDNAARAFDLMNGFGPELRWAPAKRRLFSLMRGKILFVAVGTGLDIQFFPPNQTVVAVDISEKMLERARKKAARYDGHLELKLADVQALDEPHSRLPRRRIARGQPCRRETSFDDEPAHPRQQTKDETGRADASTNSSSPLDPRTCHSPREGR